MISYEEYHPYGSTAYQAGRSVAEVRLKRYRYTGKERDEEMGLNHHGARYYAPWLARWTAADPVGLADGPERYAYARNNSVTLMDRGGTLAEESTRSYEGPRSVFEETIEVTQDSPNSGLAGSSVFGQIPQEPETHEGTIPGRAITPDAPRTFTGPGALREARKAVRQELFIEATAQNLLGGKGRTFEYAAILFKEPTPSGEGIQYSHTRAFPGKEPA